MGDAYTTQEISHDEIMAALKENKAQLAALHQKVDMLLAILAPVKKALAYFASAWKVENP